MSRQVCGGKKWVEKGETTCFFLFSLLRENLTKVLNLCRINYSFILVFIIYLYLFLDFRIDFISIHRDKVICNKDKIYVFCKIFLHADSVGCITYPGSPCICDRYLCGTTCRRCYFLLTFTRPRVSGFQTGPRHPRANIATNI